MTAFLTILFIALAAACKAVADTLKDHYYDSIFRYNDPRFWNPDVSWKEVGYIRFTKFHPDAWHLANSAMLLFFIAAIIIHHPYLQWYFELPIVGVFYNIVFNLFYDHILKKKS